MFTKGDTSNATEMDVVVCGVGMMRYHPSEAEMLHAMAESVMGDTRLSTGMLAFPETLL